jgi:predicted nucleic acid-binding protein
MADLVIADTSALIVLTNSGHLPLLHALFPRIIVTSEVEAEFGQPLPAWISVETVAHKGEKPFLIAQLGKGEASSMFLALENAPCLLLIDEKKGRKVAMDLGLQIIGTLRVLILAKESGLIISLRQAIDDLMATGFRLSPVLIAEVLDKFEP